MWLVIGLHLNRFNTVQLVPALFCILNNKIFNCKPRERLTCVLG